MRFALALFFLALAAPTLALKCYSCVDCANDAPTEMECPNLLVLKPTCQKQVIGDLITKSCSTEVLCNAAQAASSAESHCCDDDLCNGTPAPLAGLGLLLAPALAYLAA